jgi:hypothetical protein
MRRHALYFFTEALVVTGVLFSAGAQPALAKRQIGIAGGQVTPTPVCRPGWVWEPDGYAPHGALSAGE